MFKYDYWLLFTTIFLLIFGLLMLGSSSMGVAEHSYNAPFHFLLHQAAYMLCGVVLATIIMRFPVIIWEKLGGYSLLISLALLFVVLIPGVGHEVNGSMRWIGIGAFTVQVSEFVKFGVIIYIAGYLLRREEEVRHSIQGFLKPLVIIVLIAGLLLMEPDFGATVVIVCTIFGMVFLAGARLWKFMVLLVFAAAALGVIAIASPYRLLRLTTFLNPWATPYDSGYQLIQALVAFGRGGFWGVGLGNSIQKLFYLPEAHTDFLYAIIAEELGMVGQFLILGLFAFLVGRILYLGNLARRMRDYFASYLAYGLGLLLGVQVIINVGVNIGLLPTKGLTLPFMSYGGSSMLSNCAIMAIILRIYHELQINKNKFITVSEKLPEKSYDPSIL
jgi:cell division protein FtsW